MIRHAAIVPLIGGQTLGVMEVLNGQLPEYILSYSVFKKNDSHLIEYLRKKGWTGDYIVLDELEDEYIPRPKVDIINAVPPCAGLSSLSITSKHDNPMNDWMYKTAEHALSIEKPKIFFGENAPHLSTKKGLPVVERLNEIGERNGYKLALYYTESRYHGNPQKRPRTFYVFYKGNKIPILPWFNQPKVDVKEILSKPLDDNDKMNILIRKDRPIDNPWVAYCLHKAGCSSIQEYYEKIDRSVVSMVEAGRLSESYHEVANWFDSQGYDPKYSKRARYNQEKNDKGMNFWAHNEMIPKGDMPSLIGCTVGITINPFRDSYLTIRDCLRLMRMPDDFDLIGENPLSSINHVCQNVIVSTAKDLVTGLVMYLNGELDSIENGNVMKQNNTNQTIDWIENQKVNDLGDFLV